MSDSPASGSGSGSASAPEPGPDTVFVPERDLPASLDHESAVEAAYAEELAEAADCLGRGLPVLIECDKELAPYLYANLRARLRARNLRCDYIGGRPRADEVQANPVAQAQSLTGVMIQHLRDAVRGNTRQGCDVVVLPHLDLLTTSQGGLTGEAREVIPLLYENPDMLWVGFKDPSFPLPDVIVNLFPRRISLLGVRRSRLRKLVTQREARKFGRNFNPWALYKHVSGLNAVRLRKLLSTLDGRDYPDNPRHVIAQLRRATLGGTLEIPEVDLDRDLGGYGKVKTRIKQEILDILARKDDLSDPDAIRSMENLIPKGMIFWGPPGTGKTLFAKAIATALGAAVTIVSGPELKSKWVGESEENLRRIFRAARQSAPSIIVFDELDSFATARGTYAGSGVEHSMINQLLTEMDGFHREELVFVIGTTNFVESLDPALMRPGRFEFQLHIPHPDADDRRAILEIYNRSMRLGMTEEALDRAVRLTADLVPGGSPPARYTGDHINALCRTIARARIRRGDDAPTSPEDVERAVSEWIEAPKISPAEERVVAVHEVGHAVCSLFCEHAPPIDRVSIRGDLSGALGFVQHQEKANRYVVTRGQLLDDLCILMGGREAERMLLEDLSIGSADDLRRATGIARALVEQFGMGGDEVGLRRYVDDEVSGRRFPHLSDARREALDNAIAELLEQARARAADILTRNRALVETLRDELLARKVLDAKTFAEMTSGVGVGARARARPSETDERADGSESESQSESPPPAGADGDDAGSKRKGSPSKESAPCPK